MASKARQSVLGGLFGLSLYFVIFPFLMRLRSSRRDDAHRIAPHCISDKKHAVVDKTNSIETQFAAGMQVVELDHIQIQKDPGRGPEDYAVLPQVDPFFGSVPFEIHSGCSDVSILIFSTSDKRLGYGELPGSF